MTMRILNSLAVALTLTLLVGSPMFAAAEDPDHKMTIPIKGGVPDEFIKSGQRTFDVHMAQLTVRAGSSFIEASSSTLFLPTR